MGRFELKHFVKKLEDVTRLCEEAITYHADAVVVPPVFASSAFEMLKSTKIEIVCPAAESDDTLETKITAIESNRFAQSVIVSVPQGHVYDGLWDLMSKELTQLYQIAEIHRKSIWVKCRFSDWSRVKQSQICEAIPRGMGLRVTLPESSDIKFSKLVSPNMPLCVLLGSDDTIEEYHEADCFEVFTMPPQKNTNQLFINGEKV